MNIEETNILDITPTNIEQTKVALANNIITSVFPLFDEIFHGKIVELKERSNILKTIKSQLKNEKTEIISILKEYKKKQKVSKLLNRIEKLVSSGLVYDSSIKHETVILLKILDKLPEDKIDDHINKTLHMINKRFSKII